MMLHKELLETVELSDDYEGYWLMCCGYNFCRKDSNKLCNSEIERILFRLFSAVSLEFWRTTFLQSKQGNIDLPVTAEWVAFSISY